MDSYERCAPSAGADSLLSNAWVAALVQHSDSYVPQLPEHFLPEHDL